MTLKIVDRPSPNFNERPAGVAIDILLLHYTGMQSAEEALSRLCDPAAKVSAHYTIDLDGAIYRHVEDAKRAWHAGVSFWAGERDINGRSIGIELVNPGHEFGYNEYPEAQIQALMALGTVLRREHPIPVERVLGHSDVAPARKRDPGELFPWDRLAKHGLGIYADRSVYINYSRALSIEDLQRDLSGIGYECPHSRILDEQSKYVIQAFQCHFRPTRCDGIPDAETAAIAASLARRFSRKSSSRPLGP